MPGGEIKTKKPGVVCVNCSGRIDYDEGLFITCENKSTGRSLNSVCENCLNMVPDNFKDGTTERLMKDTDRVTVYWGYLGRDGFNVCFEIDYAIYTISKQVIKAIIPKAI